MNRTNAERPNSPGRMRFSFERLEDRLAPSATASLIGDVLTVSGDDADARIFVGTDPLTGEIVVRNLGQEIGRFDPAAVGSLAITTGAGNDRIDVVPAVTVPATIVAGDGKNIVNAGGGASTVQGGIGTDKLAGGTGTAVLLGGGGNDQLVAGQGATVLDGQGGFNRVFPRRTIDSVFFNPQFDLVAAFPDPEAALAAQLAAMSQPQETLTQSEVQTLLDRASAATASNDGIIVVVDRNGRFLGVKVENGVAPEIQGNTDNLVFAVDGAFAKALTGAYFASSQGPLTSRTIQFISQSTITQREVESNPNITDPNSTVRGPGYVAAVGLGGHFPPGISNTPPVDLFGIEHTNRDGSASPGPDRIKGTPDDIPLMERFNIDPAFIPPGQNLYAPDSYGVVSGLLPGAQSRGIATLPGGIPIVKNGQVVGGIGVFYPGKTGYATEENNVRSSTYDPTKPDRTLEAEFAAFVAVGGSSGSGFAFPGTIGDAPALPSGFDLPFARIDLVGITLDLFGPGGIKGPENLVNYGLALGTGTAAASFNLPVGTDGGGNPVFFQAGNPVPEGWIVTPHDGVGVTAAEVEDMIVRGFTQAVQTRAAIRQIGSFARMVFAVADLEGNVVGLYRMPDATVFSIDVAVAKARNVGYYANTAELQPMDQIPGVPAGTAFTNRTFRYAAQPRFPEGIDLQPPGPFSILQDGGSDPLTGLTTTALPASAFQSPYGFDSFNPGTNFRDPTYYQNQNGVVWFPGSAPVYRGNGFGGGDLIGGFGVSGDGVDQDDVVTFIGSTNFGVPDAFLRADEVKVTGIRLPYQKFNRNPEGGIPG